MRTPALFLILCLAASSAGAQIVPDWSGESHPPVPLTAATLIEPVLSAADVTDDDASLVADPFLMHEAPGPWHMFMEVLSNTTHLGRIGHATSPDGIHWTYDQIVLDQPFHLSYPYVFRYNGLYYMVVFSSTDEQVLLFRAYNYPYDWRRTALLLAGREFADASIIRCNGTWYMFVGRSSGGECWLYWSNLLTAGWVQHPASPIVRDFGKARPAGRPFLYGGRLIRLAQKNDDHYGEAVRAFAVDTISPTQYSEHEIPESPILWANGHGWNRGGMHTCDAWWDGDHWIASVDGLGNTWSIGIYRSGTVSGLEEGSGATPSLRIDLGQNSPNPFESSTDVLIRLASAPMSDRSRLGVYDVSGRLVRSLPIDGPENGSVRVSWNGTDERGRRVPPGTYFYRLDPPRGSNARRMILIR